MRGVIRPEAEQYAVDSLGLRSKIFDRFEGSHIINKEQEELVQIYSKALQKDLLKEQAIKSKLDLQFFNLPRKPHKKIRLESRPPQPQPTPSNLQVSKEMKKRILGERKPISPLRLSPTTSPRYGRTLSPDLGVKRLLGTPNLEERESSYSYKIDELIQSSLISSRKSRGRNVVTATQRKRMVELKDRSEKQQIIDRIVEEELEQGKNIGKVLTNFEKYNMSFVNYVKKKTANNIEKSIFHEKLRPKESYVEKFQDFILSELKFSEQAKRRLEKVFKGIELQYKRPSKNRQLSQRAKK